MDETLDQASNVSDTDRLMAALAWVFWPAAVVILFVQNNRNRPFQRYHAVSALAFVAAFVVFLTVIAALTSGWGLCLSVVGFVTFYWAYLAYQGHWLDIPVLSRWLKQRYWISEIDQPDQPEL